MTQRQITPPATLAVTLDQAKANMRIDGSDMDALVMMWIAGVTATVEHELGRALVTQGWRVTLDAFPAAIRLAMPPLMSVESVKFFDVAGALQILDPLDYVVDAINEPGYIMPAPGKAWPATAVRVNAVMVDYTCGYTAGSMPANVSLYILAKLVEQFDPATRMERDTVQSIFLDRLLDACRTYS